ncbi:DUF262 domain-containing protein [Mycoplasmopsis verecunda]|uniref:Uncharacterized conserved protein, contains ParB-like and HNH nuclease domains n=1 Tax=Mycoplasmopsis verecunda TaxID=171291 RepID=A0A1T4L3E7_9BACT|nr:DUF262 domain-containing protein [Mycoplasmopsis verecunda]WPB54446.1 DUF262 domain-containing HNH endonuclease family protein [Mycoplasmopsis verecunda]SJZ49236.1 Uncharacterized conserved protein, contains ParB-like and HNH nuclease domains [Mycoplasmopsis verecunda]
MNDFKIKRSDLEEIFRNIRYVIPSYQRPYVWKEEQITTLLDDLIDFFDNEIKNENSDNQYFLGSIILCKVGDFSDKYYILDGQQRLITLYLIWLCMLDLIWKKYRENKDLLEKISGTFPHLVFPFFGLNRRYIPKISFETRSGIGIMLSDLIKASYNGKIDELLDSKEFKRTIKNDETKKSILHAINCIRDYISSHISNNGKDSIFNQPTLLGEFINNFYKSKIVFAKIETDTISDAYNLFNIINNRGVKLSNSDILKTVNLQHIALKEQNPYLEDYAKEWENIENSFRINDKKQKVDFDIFLELIRAIYIKKSGSKSLFAWFEEDIFKLKNTSDKKPLIKPGVEFINKLSTLFDVYKNDIDITSISNQNDIKYINTLKIMSRYIPDTQWISPVLMFNDKFSDQLSKDVSLKTKFILKFENYYTYYWITSMTRSRIFTKLADILNLIEKSNTVQEVLDSDIWTRDFNAKMLEDKLKEDIYTQRFNNYILHRCEKILCDEQSLTETQDKITIEHILPQKMEGDWFEIFSAEKHKELMHKIGNLTLITKKNNSKISNKSINEKLNTIDTMYKDFLITKNLINFIKQQNNESNLISDNGNHQYQWNEDLINKRGEQIIKLIIDDYKQEP